MKPYIYEQAGRGERKLMNARDLEEVLAAELPEQQFLMPGILPVAETVFVTVEPDAEVPIFALLLAYAVAAGKEFSPFGTGASEKVMYISGSGKLHADQKRSRSIHNRDPFSTSQERANKNLTIHTGALNNGKRINLNSKSDQQRFLQLIPLDTRLIVFENLWTSLPSTPKDGSDFNYVRTFLDELNERGFAVLALIPAGKKVAARSERPVDEYCLNSLTLSMDLKQQDEFGGSLLVKRPKLDDEDRIPTRFSFWWHFVDEKFDFGWNSTSHSTGTKRRKIYDRRDNVAKLLAEGTSIDAIAEELKVSRATIVKDSNALQA